MRDYRKLNVWQKSHELALLTYELTSEFPKHEIYGLTSQIRRAGTSVPANIAEGCGRGSPADLARFLHIAMGSASELEYLALLAHELGLVDDIGYGQLSAQVVEVKRMLTSLIHKLTS